MKGESVVKGTKEDEFCRDSVSDDFEEWDREERKREAAKPLFLVRYE